MKREIQSPPPTVLTSKSFDGKHEIGFNEASHRYKWLCACHKGEPSVGVTTFLKNGYVTSMGLISWFKAQSIQYVIDWFQKRGRVDSLLEDELKQLFKDAKAADREKSQEAADIGTILHTYSELHSLGKTDEANKLLEEVKQVEKWPVIESCIAKYHDWDKKNKGELVGAESLIASPMFSFCGKIDRLDRVNGKLRLRDYKTSKSIYPEQFVQLGAYTIGIREWLGKVVEELEIIRFGKEDGEFENILITDPAEIRMFQDQALRCLATHNFRKIENDPRFKYEAK